MLSAQPGTIIPEPADRLGIFGRADGFGHSGTLYILALADYH